MYSHTKRALFFVLCLLQVVSLSAEPLYFYVQDHKSASAYSAEASSIQLFFENTEALALQFNLVLAVPLGGAFLSR